MDEVYAIIVACGLLRGEPDCIKIQEQSVPILEWQCESKLFELRLDFELMRVRLPKFKDYVIVEQSCKKESLPYGRKPHEEET